jgi:hypothetical protein
MVLVTVRLLPIRNRRGYTDTDKNHQLLFES